jgi:hypothetical protein
LLDARNRAGLTVIDIVASDLEAHGAQVVATLRERDPAAYARLASDLVAFKALLREHTSPDKPIPAAVERSGREGLAGRLLEAVAADFAEHGAASVAALRERNPTAYARLVGECVQFRMLTAERAPRTNPFGERRKPRPLRMKELLEEMEDRPIDVNNPRLPPKHLERWLQAMEALRPRIPGELTPDELREVWGADLSEWYERQCRNRSGSTR